MLKTIRAVYRLLLFVVLTSYSISAALIGRLLLGKNMTHSLQVRRKWARGLLKRIGVRMHVSGPVPDFPCLIMANHRSYLDPIVIIHDVLAFPVSKAEVAKWPIVGYGAKVTGILFLQRESATSRRTTLNGIVSKIKEGYPVILFPEGTTHSGKTTLDFRPGGFKMAASEGFPIVPVVVEYKTDKDYWVGDQTFLPHFMDRFGEPHMEVYVRYGNPIQGADAQTLLQQAREWIDAELLKVQQTF